MGWTCNLDTTIRDPTIQRHHSPRQLSNHYIFNKYFSISIWPHQAACNTIKARDHQSCTPRCCHTISWLLFAWSKDIVSYKYRRQKFLTAGRSEGLGRSSAGGCKGSPVSHTTTVLHTVRSWSFGSFGCGNRPTWFVDEYVAVMNAQISFIVSVSHFFSVLLHFLEWSFRSSVLISFSIFL